MKKLIKFAIFMTALLAIGGVVAYQQFILADYTYHGDGKRISELFAGPVSVTGDANRVTLLSGSEVPTLTILGSNNVIEVQSGARLGEVRGIGHNNSVLAPSNSDIDMNVVGQSNDQRVPQPESLDGL